jgi:heat shock protein HslJ
VAKCALSFILSVAALLLTACGPIATPPGTDAALPGTLAVPSPGGATAQTGGEMDLEGSEWLLTSLRGSSPLGEAAVSLGFYPDDYMEGTAGCNSYGANYTTRGLEFRIAQIHRTAFDCEDPPGIQQQEVAFFEALEEVAAYRGTADRLAFDDAAGETILVFARKLPPAVDPALQDTGWTLTLLQGQNPVEGSLITLHLGQQGFEGYAGCNHYGGEYEVAGGGSLAFAQLSITEMDCPAAPGVMEQERAYVEVLWSAAAYRLTGDRLEIQDGGGQTILVFGRQEAYEGNPADLLGTAWQLVSMDGQPPVDGSTITLAFPDAYRASGFGGCQNYVTTYQATGSELRFEYLGMLWPMCPDEVLLEQEGTYTSMLGWTTDFRLHEGQLALRTIRGEVLTFAPLPEEVQAPLEGTPWTLIASLGTPQTAETVVPVEMPLIGTQITATLDGSTMSGSAGCNDYGAAYHRDGDAWAFKEIVATEMACLDPEGMMEQEGHYFDFLRGVRSGHVYGNQLWLECGDGRALVFSVGGLSSRP